MSQSKVVEKRKIKYIIYLIFFPESLAVYEIMWKNKVGPDRPHDNIIRRRRIVYGMTKVIDTKTACAFPWQQWFRVSMLRLYINCLSDSFMYVRQYCVFNRHI